MGYTKVEDGMPEVILDNEEGCNGVLALQKNKVDGGYQEMVSNTEYFNKNPDEFTHWMYLPDKPE